VSEVKLCQLGKTNNYGRTEIEYLYDFTWDCDWYWGGGYVGNRNLHHHFKGLKEGNINLYSAFTQYYSETKLTDDEIWRLCDLMKQFYAHKESAECFHSGGHYTSKDRNDAEINKDLEDTLNNHIKNVIIPEVRSLLKGVDSREWRKL